MNVKHALFAILFCAMPALGQGYGGYSAPPSMPSAMDQARPSVSPSSFPWTKDLALLDTLKSDVHSGGMAAVAAHVDELEQALKNPQLTFTSKSGGKTTVYFLADGAGESMAAMAAVKPAEGMSIVTMDNPYPKLSLYLALYYNSTGKSDQALRMADAGMKLSPLADFHLGATVPALTVARGAALDHLGRWQDEIDNADAGLKLAGEGGAARALLYWGGWMRLRRPIRKPLS